MSKKVEKAEETWTYKCDNCGRGYTGQANPTDWYSVTWRNPEHYFLARDFCCATCLSIYMTKEYPNG